MTEPPEPREPEEGRGEDDTDWGELERNAARDFVADATPDMQEAIDAARAEMGDEAFDAAVAEVLRRANDPMRYTADLEELAEEEELAELDDDVTLDVLGSGEDIEGDDLADMLGAWRDDVDSVPHSPGTGPDVVQQIHDFTKEIDRATEPPHTQEGSTQSMISEDAAQLRLIANDITAAQAYEAALNALNDQVIGALSYIPDGLSSDRANASAAAGGEESSAIEGAAGQAISALESAIGLAAQLASAISDAAAQNQAFRSAVGEVAQRHGA